MSQVAQEETERNQRREIEQVERQLAELRDEYRRVCDERGTAHKVAAVVRAQESEIGEFNARMEKVVKLRAMKVAREEQHRHEFKIANDAQSKRNLLLKRKELFERDWTDKENLKNDKSRNQRQIELELKKLIDLEKKIETKINKTKQTKSHAESSVERETQKVMWPEKPVPNWRLMADDSSSIHDVPLENSHSYVQARRDENLNKSSSIRDRLNLNQPDYLNDENFPAQIAEKVYDRLEKLKHARGFNINTRPARSDDTRDFRDAAINTSAPITRSILKTPASSPIAQQNLVTRPKQIEQVSTGSADTSYRSLPKDYIRPENLKKAVRALENQAADLELSRNTTSDSNIVPELEQLIDKIENIKQAIEIERQAGLQSRPRELSTITEDSDSCSSVSSSKSTERELHAQTQAWKSPQILITQANQTSPEEELSISSLSSNVGTFSGTESSSDATQVAGVARDKKKFWRDVYAMAGVTLSDSVVAAVDTVSPARGVAGPSNSQTPRTERNSDIRHSTPKISSGLFDEPNLTLIQSFTSDDKEDGDNL